MVCFATEAEAKRTMTVKRTTNSRKDGMQKFTRRKNKQKKIFQIKTK